MTKTSAFTSIKWLFTIAVPLCIQFLPISGDFTLQMREFLVATTFVIFLAAFELLPNMLVGLLMPVAYILTGTVPAKAALGVWSGSLMIFMIIGGMIFANALDESGLLKRIVLWAGSKCKGSLLKLLLATTVAGLAIMTLTFMNGWLITLILCYSIVKALKLENTSEGILFMIVAQIVSTAALNWVYAPQTNALWAEGVRMIVPGFEMPWYILPVYNFPYLIVQFILIMIFYKLYKPQKLLKGGEKFFNEEYAKLGPITPTEIKAIILTLLLFAYIFTYPLHGFDMNYAFIIVPILCFMPGIQIATQEKSLNTVSFGFILFLAACMSIGVVGGMVGIGPVIGKHITPLLEGLPIPLFLFLCIIFGILMNILMTPVAMQAMFPGPLAAIALGLGVSYPLLPYIAMNFANDMVFFPYENAFLLVMYGFGVMSMKEFMKFNVIKMGATLVLFWPIVLPFWYALGLM